jgi:hypothetical protein
MPTTVGISHPGMMQELQALSEQITGFPLPAAKQQAPDLCQVIEVTSGSTSTPPSAVTRPRRSITIWVASWRISAASWLT